MDEARRKTMKLLFINEQLIIIFKYFLNQIIIW